jgi:predicted phosphodiesterase
MTIVLQGDTHGNGHALVDGFYHAHENKATAIIQLGDFGYGWLINEDKCEFSKLAAEMVDKLGIPFYWIDGNHENFNHLYAQPLDENGHRTIFPGVTHLQRGSTITIDGTTFMAFGGAVSVDKERRKLNTSWWEQEAIIPEDLTRAEQSGRADIFLSHDSPYGSQDEASYKWLARTFGETASLESQANQHLVRQALDASGAKVAFHGHLHRHYQVNLDNGVVVTGLNQDGEEGNLYLLDIKDTNA